MAGLDRPLDPVELRVVGCLVEKELSTPDAYPLSLAALLTACNQSSNRDPVMALEIAEVEEALRRLMADVLVWRERGARTLRWKHQLDSKLGLDRPAKAVLAELALRGAQTPGELRSRCTRMHAFASLGEVEQTLRSLADQGLAEELPRAPGQKERRWQQLLGREGSHRATEQKAAPGELGGGPTGRQRATGDALEARLAALESEVAELARRLARLEEGQG
jgi:uncharacterized protein